MDCSRLMEEGKSSSQRLFSLKSTERKTPAVLLSSKDEAMRWNMGSTCGGRSFEKQTRARTDPPGHGPLPHTSSLTRRC